MATVIPLIVITGPTGSGKTGLALRLAEKWGGEIICADSRTVYKGMNIGTAKPTAEEQKRVRHWLLDVTQPDERFTVADFQKQALSAIADIRSRGKVPFLVGGTGLYIDAVVLGFSFGPEADEARRRELESMSIGQLQSLISEQRLSLPENAQNKRYLIRRLEKNNSITSGNSQPEPHTYVFAIATEKATLRERLAARTDEMFAQNIVKETQQLLKQYGPENEAMTGNIYRIVRRMIDDEIDEAMAKALCVTRDWQLAKRQVTWLKRHDYVHWVALDKAEKEIDRVIQKYRDARTI